MTSGGSQTVKTSDLPEGGFGRTSTVERPARYTITICKGSSLLNETRLLLGAWRPGEPLKVFHDRVLQSDLLGKTTARRAEDLLRRVFERRFLQPTDQPARMLRRLVGSGPGMIPSVRRIFADLCLLYSARLDGLLRDVITEVYWPAARAGQLPFGKRDVLVFIDEAEQAGRVASPWSDAVKTKVARGLLRAMAEFGLLSEPKRSRFEIRPFQPDDGTIVYLAHELHFAGVTDTLLARHPDWQLYGLQPAEVSAAIDRLTADGWWIAQSGGGLLRISWKHETLEEVVDALVG